MRRFTHLTAGLLAGLALGGTGVGAATAPVPSGALSPLSGPGACLGGHCGQPLRPYASRRAGLGPLHLFALGRRLYAIQDAPAVLDVLSRDPATGALAQLPGGKGCFTARPATGCTTVAAWRGHGITGLRDGTIAVHLGHHRTRLQRVDPATGRLRRGRIVHGCLGRLSGPCLRIPGIRGMAAATTAAPGLDLVSGYTRAGATLVAVLHRFGGRWHRVDGRDGCVSSDGSHGCRRLACLRAGVTAARRSPDGHDLYVAGGIPDDESTEDGYVATFARVPGGGMRPLGCVATGSYRGSSEVPVWMSTLPHSDRVLIAELRGNRGDGIVFERIYASRPGPGGALGAPVQISADLPDTEGQLTLSHDGRTLYAAGTGGGLGVLRVGRDRVRPLPGRWATPYRSPNRYGFYGGSGFILPGAGRVLYLATSAGPGEGVSTPPAVRVLRVAP